MELEIHDIYKNHGSVKFLIGRNTVLLLVYENYMYKRINTRYPKTTWKCIGCTANVFTNSGIFVKANQTSPHSHAPPIDEVALIETNMRIKKRVQNEFNLTPRQIHA